MYAGLLLAGLALVGCEMKRPKGAYTPTPLVQPIANADASAEAEEEGGVAPPAPPPTDSGTGDSGDDPGTQGNPLAALQGDYAVRFDNVTVVDTKYLGEVTSTTTSYGVLRVVLEDGQLTTSEWLCSSNTEQEATKGEAETIIDDVVWNSLSVVPRDLDVDLEKGTWSTTLGTRRHGWKQSAPRMPTDPGSTPEDFLDPEQDGLGVTVTVDAKGMVALLPFEARCRFDTTSFATTRYYKGKLDEDGLLTSAEVEVDDSDVHAWRATRVSGSSPCDTSDVESADARTDRDDITLARLPDWLEATEDDPKPCPMPAQFRQLLP